MSIEFLLRRTCRLPWTTLYAWDISHTLVTTYHPYCHSPSALTEYLKQKLCHQWAKRLGRSPPTQVEQSVQLERNSHFQGGSELAGWCSQLGWWSLHFGGTGCHVLIRLHISRSYIGLPLFFLPLPIPEALYNTDLVRVCVWYNLVARVCTISISEPPLLQYLVLGELQSPLA